MPDGTPNTFVVAGKEQAGVTAGAPLTPFLFRTYPAPAAGGRPKDGSSGCAVWQAGRATSAAPTYFAPLQLLRCVGRPGNGIVVSAGDRLVKTIVERANATRLFLFFLFIFLLCFVSLTPSHR